MATIVTIKVYGPGFSGGDYATLKSALTAFPNKDLVSADIQVNFECRGKVSLDTDSYVRIRQADGWYADATRYIKIYADPQYRHNGTRDNFGAYMKADGYYCINIETVTHTQIIGLAFTGTAVSSHLKTGVTSNYTLFKNCLFDNTAAQWGTTHDGTQVNYIVNCRYYNATAWNIRLTGAGTLYIYNTICLNAAQYNINCVSYGTVYGHNLYLGGAGEKDFQNTVDGIIHNTKVWTSDVSGTAQHSVASCNFVNSNAGEENATIQSGSVLLLAADDLSSDAVVPFNDDFTGAVRPSGKWDIGDYQYPETLTGIFRNIFRNPFREIFV